MCDMLDIKTFFIIYFQKNEFSFSLFIKKYHTPHIQIYKIKNYGIMTWGLESDRIPKLQTKAVQIISLSKYNA